jgi:hypothetical protein
MSHGVFNCHALNRVDSQNFLHKVIKIVFFFNLSRICVLGHLGFQEAFETLPPNDSPAFRRTDLVVVALVEEDMGSLAIEEHF